ncbi:MAG: hypothetical protein HBSAPP04_00020 [Ignavibacteriaceae bacterium]|nr:MAG: hypothetical protein EDM75_13005 [Chlorobiota bacterium]GJQ31163.1 MAG: hypothetical protein HBSAPP04_00020 [Ignavibacteriaceae bacterium]
MAAVTGYILKFRGLTRGRVLVITGLLLLLIALTLPPFLISYDEARNLRECVVLDSSIHLYEIPEREGKKAGLITEGTYPVPSPQINFTDQSCYVSPVAVSRCTMTVTVTVTIIYRYNNHNRDM